VFAPSCSYNACHFGANAKQGLDLAAADLHAELLGHTVVHDVGMPLVDPGNPDNSWLYRILSECNPPNRTGGTEPHMPLNAPTLLDDGLVAKVRVWIENGALDD